MLIEDGYSILVDNKYWIRPLTDRERRTLQGLLIQDTWEAEQYLMRGRVTTLSGRKIDVPEEEEERIGILLCTWPDEHKDLDNLKQAARMAFQYPLLSLRSCQVCKAWWFDEDTGKVVRIGDQNLRRPAHSTVACDTTAGCLKGHYTNPIEFSDKNRRAFNHWLEWRHVGFPEPQDAIVRRNWKWLEALATKYGFDKDRRTTRNQDRG